MAARPRRPDRARGADDDPAWFDAVPARFDGGVAAALTNLGA